MSPSTTEERTRRTGRKLAISAAALLVTLLPTACDYSYAGQLPSAAPGHSGHGAAPTTAPVVVPVGNTEDESQAGDAPDGNAQDGNDGGGANGDGAGNGGNGGGNGNGNGDASGEDTPPADEAPVKDAPGDEATGEDAPAEETPAAEASGDEATGDETPADETPAAEPTATPPANNGLDVLGTSCANSKLPPHTGFQESPACVSSSHGEVAPEDRLPSLLITSAPTAVDVGEGFTLSVSTRNLVRDRFLGAAAGGYYLESSFLNDDLLQRGHFHTACRILPNTNEAPDSSGAPEFFVATQDNGGGRAPDTVQIAVPGLKKAGVLQCTSWAGDGSHRTPMMTRANQTPAIDSVRITVGGGGAAGAGADDATADNADADNAGDNAGADNAGADNAGDNAGADNAGAADNGAADNGAADNGAAADAGAGNADNASDTSSDTGRAPR